MMKRRRKTKTSLSPKVREFAAQVIQILSYLKYIIAVVSEWNVENVCLWLREDVGVPDVVVSQIDR
jgi:hypothetical protein